MNPSTPTNRNPQVPVTCWPDTTKTTSVHPGKVFQKRIKMALPIPNIAEVDSLPLIFIFNDEFHKSQLASAGVFRESLLGTVGVVQFVHVLAGDHFSPAVFVHVVDSHQTTAAGVAVGRVVDGFATCVMQAVPSSTASSTVISKR
jgi:hypothetical protein